MKTQSDCLRWNHAGRLQKVWNTLVWSRLAFALVFLVFSHGSAVAYLADDLGDLTGYTVVSEEKIDGTFDGCAYGETVLFQSGRSVTCSEYGYQYAYYADAVVLASPYADEGRTVWQCAMVVRDKVYDVGCDRYMRDYVALLGQVCSRMGGDSRVLCETRLASLKGMLVSVSVPGESADVVWQRFRDCAGCPEMTILPSGVFTMGSPSEELERHDGEGPRREVSIAGPLAVGVYEVTRGEFAEFVSASGYSAVGNCHEWDGDLKEWRESAIHDWRDPGFEQTDLHPVVCVDWHDARAYADWLSVETGERYRLPSEAEWEYAARAGSKTARYWGESDDGQCWYANGADTGSGFGEGAADCDDDHPQTAPVGSYVQNGFGLYDVLGDVWEMTADCWNESYAGAPADGAAWEQGDCVKRVMRGGSWYSGPRSLRSAVRSWSGTAFRGDGLGFRVVREIVPEPLP